MPSPQRPAILEEAFSAEVFRRRGHQLIDQLADHVSQAQRGDGTRVMPWQSPAEALQFWRAYISSMATPGPERAGDFAQLVDETLARSVSLHHPHFLGHQINPPALLGPLAALVVDLLNNGMGVYEMGMAGTAMEQLVIRQVADQLGMPAQGGGFLTSGGSLANLTALLAARARLVDEDVWKQGTRRQLTALVSEAAHYCIDRAVRIMGLGDAGIFRVPVNSAYQMRADQLAQAKASVEANGGTVFAVVANAASTATGSFDPLDPIADFCAEQQLWMHVDGAHGAAACFSARHRHLLNGVARADSVTLDFHKLLLTPALASALIFRHQAETYRTFAQQADYLFVDQDNSTPSENPEWYNLARRTFECTKHMMSFKIFALIATYGTQLYEAHVDYLFELSQSFAAMIGRRSRFRLAVWPQANILCFQYVPTNVDDRDLGSLNARIREAMVQQGDFYLVQTNLGGQTWLRTTLSNPATTTEHLTRFLDEIEQVGAALA